MNDTIMQGFSIIFLLAGHEGPKMFQNWMLKGQINNIHRIFLSILKLMKGQTCMVDRSDLGHGQPITPTIMNMLHLCSIIYKSTKFGTFGWESLFAHDLPIIK